MSNNLVAALTCIGDGVILVDLSSNIEFMNESAEKLTGWKLQEVTGYPVDQFFSLVDSQTMGKLNTPISEVIASGVKVGLKKNTVLISRSGVKFYISASFSPISHTEEGITGVVVVFRDITRIRNMEEKILLERNNLKWAIEAIPAGILFLDETMRIKRVNKKLLEILQKDMSELLKKKLGEGLECINSVEKGCGNDINCLICEIRQNILEVLKSGLPRYDVIIQYNFFVKGRKEVPWLKINFMPVNIEGNRHVMVVLDDVTEQKNREEQLIRTNEFISKLLDRFPIMAWRASSVDACDFINHTWLEYTGMSLEEAMGSGFLKAFHLKEIDKIRTIIEQSFRSELPFEIEHRMKHNSGEYHWVITKGKPYYDQEEKFAGFIGAVYDINDRKTAEEALINSEHKYHQLFDNAKDVIILHELNIEENISTIIDVNFTACNVLGYTKEELTHLSLHDIRTLNQREKLKETYRYLLINEHYVFESSHLTKDGREIPMEVSAHVFNLNNKNVILSVCRDISERKQVELSLLHSRDILKKAKEEAEAANRAKSEFLANMSHEIRTPLNGINGMIDLTLMTNLSDEQNKNLRMAKKCADSLLSIINDVLDYSKMEAGKFTIVNTNFNIISLIEDINKIHLVRAKEKGLDLFYSFEAGVPKNLEGDPNRLQQVLNNLINNAIKFTSKGQIVLEIHEVMQMEEIIHVRFSVRDTGIGISKENQGKLFKSFSQIDGSYTRKHGGTGLGLIISKQLVEMMGGNINVTSEEGQGSTFSFVLPFKKAKQTIELQPKRQVYVSRRNYSVLMAEDDLVNQTYLSRILENNGHHVTVANNGAEAVEAYRNGTYDLILMDIQMPVMDGVEALYQIRQYESSRGHIPVIALTAFALLGDRERFIHLGMDEYVSKPVKVEELLFIMDKAVSFQGMSAEYNEKVIVTEDGELVFHNNCSVKPFEEMKPVISRLDELLEDLMGLIKADNYNSMEEVIHTIKELFNQVDVQELKDIAFKIELLARKGKYVDILNAAQYLKDTYEDMKKSWNIMEE